jgi:hypothetical protein
MAVEHAIEPSQRGPAEVILRVRGSDEQARALTEILGRQYQGSHHPFYPQVVPPFTHWCSVRDSADGLARKWPLIEMQLLIGHARPRREPLPPPTGDNARAAGSAPAIDDAVVVGFAQLQARAAPQPAPSPVEVFKIALGRAITLPPKDRAPALEALYKPELEYTLPAALRLAELAERSGDVGRALALYSEVADRAAEGDRDAAREGQARALLAAARPETVVELIDADEPSPALRASLGIALLGLGDDDDALPHLQYAWQQSGSRPVRSALWLARLYWRRGQFHAAAEPYHYVLEQAPRDIDAGEYDTEDFRALAELGRCGELGDLPPERHLACIEAFCLRATAEQRAEDDAHYMVLHGLEIARGVDQSERLANAYRNVLDDLLQRREGAGIVALLENAASDYRRGLLDASDRYDLLDELDDHLKDYQPLLRQPLIEGFAELLSSALDAHGSRQSALPAEARDLYRSLYDLDRRNPACERYKRLLAERAKVPSVAQEEAILTPSVGGKRIALVGGHERTRQHLRERLAGWGARVDEVPPPTNGRMGEREILDRIRSSDLIVLITGYMGHDMSTIVNNLETRKALSGRVLKVDCRGASGVTREISQWAGYA